MLCQARNRDSPSTQERERGEKFFTSSFSFGREENESAGIKGSWRGGRNGNGGSFGLPWKMRNTRGYNREVHAVYEKLAGYYCTVTEINVGI